MAAQGQSAGEHLHCLGVWVDRMGLLLLLPVLLFYLTFLPALVGLLAMGLCALIMVPYLSRSGGGAGERHAVSTVVIVALAVLAAVLPGYFGLFGVTIDSPKHAYLFDLLMRNPWPVVVENAADMGVEGKAYLRYGLGYYLLPAWIAKHSGMALSACVVMYAALAYVALFSGVVAFFRYVGKTAWGALLLLGVFFLWGDFDAAIVLLRDGSAAWGQHYEWFYKGAELTSNPNLMRWVPQHLIASGYGALFFLACWYGRRVSLAQCAAPFLIIAVWSMFVALGFGLLMAIYALCCRPAWWSKAALWRDLAVSGVVAGLLVALGLYYGGGGGLVRFAEAPIGECAIGLSLGIMPLYAGVALFLRGRDLWLGRGMLLLLALLPLIHIGVVNNDFAMRASAPLLLVLRLMILAWGRWDGGIGRRAGIGLLYAVCLLDGASAMVRHKRYDWYEALVGPLPAQYDVDALRDLFVVEHVKREVGVQYFVPCGKGNLLVRCP